MSQQLQAVSEGKSEMSRVLLDFFETCTFQTIVLVALAHAHFVVAFTVDCPRIAADGSPLPAVPRSAKDGGGGGAKEGKDGKDGKDAGSVAAAAPAADGSAAPAAAADGAASDASPAAGSTLAVQAPIVPIPPEGLADSLGSRGLLAILKCCNQNVLFPCVKLLKRTVLPSLATRDRRNGWKINIELDDEGAFPSPCFPPLPGIDRVSGFGVCRQVGGHHAHEA